MGFIVLPTTKRRSRPLAIELHPFCCSRIVHYFFISIFIFGSHDLTFAVVFYIYDGRKSFLRLFLKGTLTLMVNMHFGIENGI